MGASTLISVHKPSRARTVPRCRTARDAPPADHNQMFRPHGTTKMLPSAVPVMQAIATYLVPLMVGARRGKSSDVAKLRQTLQKDKTKQ